MTAHGVGHVNLRAPAATIERLRRFYVDLVGLREGPRPRFRSGSRGYWLYAGEQALLHLSIGSDGACSVQPDGPFSHFAFACDDLTATRARLDSAGVEYATDVMDELRQMQLFLTDPAGIGVELTFASPRSNPVYIE